MSDSKKRGTGPQIPATSNKHQVMEFVNLFGTPKHNKEKAKAVRSHVMKLVRKKQSETLSRAKCLPLLPLSKKITTANHLATTKSISEQKVQPNTSHDSKTTPPALFLITDWVESTGVCGSLYGLESSTEGNPLHFPTFAPINWAAQGNSEVNLSSIPVVPRLQSTSSFATQNGDSIPISEDNTNTYRSEIARSPALLSITMNWASEYIAQGTKSEELESAMYLEQALKSITCALTDASIHGIEDSTIAAVAILSNMENLNGDMEKAFIHIRGLQSLVAMKGGIDALVKNGTLRRLVLWADLCNATRWQSMPVYPVISLPTLPSLTQFMPEPTRDLHLCLGDQIISTAISSGYSELLPLLHDFHKIAIFVDFSNLKDATLLQDMAYVDHVYLVEHKNLMLMAQYKTNPPSFLPADMNPEETLILPLLFQALTLYVYTNIRLIPIAGSIRSTLVSRIQITVAELPVPMLDVLFEAFPQEVLWIMFLAGTSSVEVTQRLFFIGHLKWMCQSLALIYWQDIEDKLRRFLWLHKQFFHRYKELWMEILSYIPDDKNWDTTG